VVLQRDDPLRVFMTDSTADGHLDLAGNLVRLAT
jgi:hypothetical protein